MGHATRLEKIGRIKVIAIVDPNTNLAEEVLKTKLSSEKVGHFYTDCKVFSHFNNLISLKPDAVFIGIPPLYRGSLEDGRDMELQFIKAGVNVFTEKPQSNVPPEKFDKYVEEVERASRENNVLVSVGYMFRYHDGIVKMKELIKAHGGKVMACRLKFCSAYSMGPLSEFSFNTDKTGGPIVEVATHVCDLARYIAGDVDLESIQTVILKDNDQSGAGCLNHLPNDVESHIAPGEKIPRVTFSHWRFKDAGIGSLMHSKVLPGNRHEISVEVQMDGLQMSLYRPVEEECTLVVRSIKSEDPNKDVEYAFPEQDSFYNELCAFIKAVRSGDRSVIESTYQDAAKTYQFTWKIRRSGETSS